VCSAGSIHRHDVHAAGETRQAPRGARDLAVFDRRAFWSPLALRKVWVWTTALRVRPCACLRPRHAMADWAQLEAQDGVRLSWSVPTRLALPVCSRNRQLRTVPCTRVTRTGLATAPSPGAGRLRAVELTTERGLSGTHSLPPLRPQERVAQHTDRSCEERAASRLAVHAAAAHRGAARCAI
jgi:hypothetical protein